MWSCCGSDNDDLTRSTRPPQRSILKGFLAKGFLAGVATLSDGLVSATLEVYGKVVREMLPTPSRPHYTFNLRDIGKVAQVINLILIANKSSRHVYQVCASLGQMSRKTYTIPRILVLDSS